MTTLKTLRGGSLLLFLLMFQGCAEIETIGNNDEIAAYAEAVFRRQNAATSRIMMSMDDELHNDPRLRRAELAMYDACKLLNEYSSREMDGEAMGVMFKRKVRASIQGCDQSIERVERILEDY